MDVADPLVEGAHIDARYTLRRRLGDGTFGEVWSAQDTRFKGRLVAIKFLKPEFLDRLEVVVRFENEAEALGMLDHPNVVGVSDRGAWGDRRFIVVEYVEGTSLEAWLEALLDARRLPEFAAVRAIFDQTCAGVAAAHAVRVPGPIVHRDLKPANVMLREQAGGELLVKVLDFGIAQLGGMKHTRTGVMGTPLYMAPEQGLGLRAEIGPWTDVFALGVILVEMLSGYAQPESDATWWGLVVQREADVAALLDSLCAGAPAPVRAVLARTLRLKGGERYADAGELRQAFRAACAATPLVDPSADPPAPSAPPPVLAPVDDAALRSTDDAALREVAPAEARVPARRSPALVAIGLGIATAAALALVVGMRREAPPAGVRDGTTTPIAPRLAAVARVDAGSGRVEVPAVVPVTAPTVAAVTDAGAPRVVHRVRGHVVARPPTTLPSAPPSAPSGSSWSSIPLAPVFPSGGPR